jgi:hypothetical protein
MEFIVPCSSGFFTFPDVSFPTACSFSVVSNAALSSICVMNSDAVWRILSRAALSSGVSFPSDHPAT